MLRGQKSKKVHNRKKHRCAQGEHNKHQVLESNLDEGAEVPGPSAREGKAAKRPGAAGAASSSKNTGLHTSTMSEVLLDDNDLAEYECYSLLPDFYMNGETSLKEALATEAKVLEQFMLYKFKMKQQTMLREMLTIINPCFEGLLPEILKRVSDHIEKVFAVQVKEVDPVHHAYDLVCKLKLPNNGRVRPGKGMPKTGLLMNVLGMIFLNGNCATEDELWEFLGIMKIYPDRKHRIYGHTRKLLTHDLVRLQYLDRQPVSKTEPTIYQLRWGPKAFEETSKMKVLDFIAKLNDKPPDSFQPHYDEAVRDEEARAQAQAKAQAQARLKARAQAKCLVRSQIRPQAGTSRAGVSQAVTSRAGTSQAATSRAGTSQAATSQAGASYTGPSKVNQNKAFQARATRTRAPQPPAAQVRPSLVGVENWDVSTPNIMLMPVKKETPATSRRKTDTSL